MKYTITTLSIIVFFFCSCGGNMVCEESVLPISTIGDNLLQNNQYILDEWMDTDIHEIEFVLNQDMTLCGVGYKSQEDDNEYLITITDNDNLIVFEDLMSFDSNRLELQEVENIRLSNGETYTLSRNCTNCTNVESRIGEMYRTSNNSSQFSFPLQSDELTILGSKFYGNGNASGNWIPRIELALF